jgi:hypothetical protein
MRLARSYPIALQQSRRSFALPQADRTLWRSAQKPSSPIPSTIATQPGPLALVTSTFGGSVPRRYPYDTYPALVKPRPVAASMCAAEIFTTHRHPKVVAELRETS